MLRWLVIAGGALCVLLLVMFVIGYLLPVEHVATRSVILPESPERVFARLEDVSTYPQWRSDLSAVEALAGGTHRRWRERGRDGTITFEIVESRAPLRLVTRIADEQLPFGGGWTFDLAPDGRNTRLTVTERGQVFNPMFRFMSRFVFGHAATLERFLRDLSGHPK